MYFKFRSYDFHFVSLCLDLCRAFCLVHLSLFPSPYSLAQYNLFVSSLESESTKWLKWLGLEHVEHCQRSDPVCWARDVNCYRDCICAVCHKRLRSQQWLVTQNTTRQGRQLDSTNNRRHHWKQCRQRNQLLYSSGIWKSSFYFKLALLIKSLNWWMRVSQQSP